MLRQLSWVSHWWWVHITPKWDVHRLLVHFVKALSQEDWSCWAMHCGVGLKSSGFTQPLRLTRGARVGPSSLDSILAIWSASVDFLSVEYTEAREKDLPWAVMLPVANVNSTRDIPKIFISPSAWDAWTRSSMRSKAIVCLVQLRFDASEVRGCDRLANYPSSAATNRTFAMTAR